MRRSIFVHISATNAEFIPKKVGMSFRFEVRFLGKYDLLMGQVVSISKMECGTLILVANDGFGIEYSACPGWQYLPIWVSQCGPSGILCYWKDLAAQRAIASYEMNEAERRFWAEADAATCKCDHYSSPPGWAD